MLGVIYKKIPFSSSQRSAGDIDSPVEKIFLLGALHHSPGVGELLVDWEDQYVHLACAPRLITAAYGKNDEFQFGRLLTQISGVSQKEIDDAYQKLGDVSTKPPAPQGHTGTFAKPSSRRIGSILVSAHLISPHLIGEVLRTQVVERTLRMLNVDTCHYTYDPYGAEDGAAADAGMNYPYLDGSVATDELIFKAFLWRLPFKTVRDFIELLVPYNLSITVPESFSLPERIAIAGRMRHEEMDAHLIQARRGTTSRLTDWLDQKGDNPAMMARMTAAFVLVYADMWKARHAAPQAFKAPEAGHVPKHPQPPTSPAEGGDLSDKSARAAEAGGAAQAADEGYEADDTDDTDDDGGAGVPDSRK